ncbi:MAG: GatB/YqeY domain-containing protein [Rubrobacteraceae bacterium]
MSIADQIQKDIKAAMKERDKSRLGALRMMNAALMNAQKETGESLSGEEEQAILRRQLKQREESAEAFRRAGREEQANRESAEAEIVRAYLPRPPSEEELNDIVDRAVSETGAVGMKDMGRAMGKAMELAGGRADGKQLSALVRNRLQ